MLDLRDPMLEAGAVIAALELRPHPEGGFFREVWRDRPDGDGRGVGTAIYFLLAADQRSHWHRVDAAECWHWYAGAPLALTLSPDGEGVATAHLGPDLGAGERPFAVVPKGVWQSAATLGRWTLVGCTVSPAFEFAGFELAPPGWHPGPRRSGA